MNQTILNRSRNDKFTLVMDIPEKLKDLEGFENADPIQFTVFGSPVPKIDVSSINLPYGGQHMAISSTSRPAYPPLNLKFLIDNKYKNYWLLWNWLNLFNDSYRSNTSMNQKINGYSEKIVLTNPFEKYVTKFSLFALDEYNNKIISFDYSGIFITGLGEINYSHQEENQIIGSATFAYNQMIVNMLK
jgi:hypothetical protein